MLLSHERPLLLGSASPRRSEILRTLGVPHEKLAVDIDESSRHGEAPEAYLERIADAKLAAVRGRAGVAGEGVPAERRASPAAHAPRRVLAALLVADTIVVVDEAILGKPVDAADGRALLRRLAGRAHEVLTRFVLAPAAEAAKPLAARTVRTRVTFRGLDDDEVDAYVASGEGADKAGGYAVQGYGAAFVERIDGSYTNVVGLPACELMIALRANGLR
jgi:septum formation protein